jgi:hypothetical protein
VCSILPEKGLKDHSKLAGYSTERTYPHKNSITIARITTPKRQIICIYIQITCLQISNVFKSPRTCIYTAALGPYLRVFVFKAYKIEELQL